MTHEQDGTITCFMVFKFCPLTGSNSLYRSPFCVTYLYLQPPFVFIPLASWAYDHNFFKDWSSFCALCRLSMSRVSNCKLGTLKAFKVFSPSQLELVLLLLQQTPHVSTIADLEYQKLHQYFPGLGHISMHQ